MNKKYCLNLLFLIGIFPFSEGKPCPEKSRPHKTRCDVFYKCAELSTDKHAWVPTRCEEGLVYEHSLAVCVLPADDWECSLDDPTIKENPDKTKNKPNGNRDADIYIVSNADGDEDIGFNSRYEDGKVEIIIGPDISEEDKSEAAEDHVYEGSGNGVESVELDGFMPAQNREVETEEVNVLTKADEQADKDTTLKREEEKTEQREELEQMLQPISTKAESAQPSTNIDPNLTAQLQRLSQLIDGLKQTYQKTKTKVQDDQNLRPDQLNAFLAHFNIKNKFDSLDPKDVGSEESAAGKTKANGTSSYYKEELNTKLNPETKVMLSHTFPQHYSSGSYETHHSNADYTNSQIVVNRPEGSVHFSLPEHHYLEHSDFTADNTPKISEETLKTVLELSKQMIAQQNVPKVIPSSSYFASPILQPILLTPHIDSPFSTNYGSQASNGVGFAGLYGNQISNSNKKPGKRPHYFDGNEDNNNIYEGNSANGYSVSKPGTTIIHNNLIPLHVSNTNSGEKEVLDSYGQSLGLYPSLHAERPDSNVGYHANSNTNTAYSPDVQSNEYSVSTTKRPYNSVSTTSTPYATTSRPFEYQPSTSTINQYFTPSQHLGNHNVNNAFQTVDNYGSTPSLEMAANLNPYDPSNSPFPEINSNNVEVRPNSQNYGSFENNNEDESQSITYTFGKKKKPIQQNVLSNYAEAGSQSNVNTVFSTNSHYMARPYSGAYVSNSFYSSGKNKYVPISSPISSAHAEGTQLVNVGGNLISFDVFQNSILPLVGNSPGMLSTSLNNIEIITCTAGVRQPNVTDCTRYYVCSKKDGRVLSYSCPPYTAFNNAARICDAKTYAMCSNEPLLPNYSVIENKRIQMEALKAIQDAKHRQQQQQAIKSNYLQQYSSPSASSSNNPFLSNESESSEINMLSSYMQQAAAMSQSVATTPRPQLTTPTVKKRKYYCKEGDKIADQTSIYSYFVCYKNSKGQMKGHKMTCSKGLLFCPKSTMCTLPSKCS